MSSLYCREERTERLKQIHEEGFEQIPQTELSSVRTTASQMLEDIEEKLEIIDRQANKLKKTLLSQLQTVTMSKNKKHDLETHKQTPQVKGVL